jgi:hypothetical protein
MSTLPAPGAIARKAVEIAVRQVGVREVGGENHGAMVREYLKSVGLDEGNPWCQAFVNWCLVASAHMLRLQFPTRGYFTTGYTPAVANWARTNSLWIGAPARRASDQVLFWIPSKGRIGHTGIVIAHDADTFTTVEGNTGSGDGVIANGDGVYKRVHRWDSLQDQTGFARLPF